MIKPKNHSFISFQEKYVRVNKMSSVTTTLQKNVLHYHKQLVFRLASWNVVNSAQIVCGVKSVKTINKNPQ